MKDRNAKQVGAALASARYAALARLGTDVATLGTFDPALVRDARLLVPMDVRALVVTAKGAEKAVPTATELPLSQPGDSDEKAMPKPATLFGDPTDRDAGVHLHWAMPDGLTRGTAGAARETTVAAGNPTSLPPLPDRWVVVRMSHGDSTTRTWVIESDRGDHQDLAGWTEPGPPAANATVGASGRRIIASAALTAAAGGELAWAATYDAVVDRFAFHDDLADVPAAKRKGLTLTYLVAGWWSDDALDPLRGCATVGAYQDRARWLGWLAPEPTGLTSQAQYSMADETRRSEFQAGSQVKKESSRASASAPTVAMAPTTAAESFSSRHDHLHVIKQGPAMPTVTLLHGTVTGVTLDGTADLAPAASAIEVAVGPTGYAALSALLADGVGDERTATERLLAAFSSGLLATIDQPNGLVSVDEDRHASAFVAFSGPARAQPDRIAEGDIMAANPARSPRDDTRHETSGSKKEKAGLEVRLTKKHKGAVFGAANEKRGIHKPGPSKSARTYRDIVVPGPRSFVPADISFVVRGAERSMRHGGDGRFTADGRLACRLPSQVVSGYQGLLESRELPPGLRSLQSGAIPPEIDLLLREAVLTDPYRWKEIAKWASDARGLQKTAVENRIKAELALRSVAVPTRGDRPDMGDDAGDALRKASLIKGDDPSPVATTRWAQPWTPLWCDWECEVAVDDSLDRWTLGEIDFDLAGDADAPAKRVVQGRSLLTSAASRALATRVRQWLAEEDARDLAGLGQLEEGEESDLAAAATAADGLDVLIGSFSGIRETLLGLDPLEASRARIDASGVPQTKPRARALPMFLAGGGARVTKLRIVDSFGRWRDVPAAKLATMEVAGTMAHPLGAPNLLLRPRLQRPSRLAFRLIDPDTPDGAPDVEARVDQQHPDRNISPVAGWLLPDHVDEALEFFDSSGTPLGQLMHDELTGLVVWEGAPGRQGPIGGPPDPGSDAGARHATRLAAGLIAADVAARSDPSGAPAESALSALLRGIDTTLWTVDPLGSLGTSAVAGLVGRPIAVVRALLRFDVVDDLDALSYVPPEDRAARQRCFAELAVRELCVRIGSLTRTDDSVLAYALDDDYTRMRLVAPEVRSHAHVSGRRRGQLGTYGQASESDPAIDPLDHPYVSGPTDVSLRSGQTVRLTLLMNPGGKMHATAGLVPRKSLALARDWFEKAVMHLSPSFRVGPVLVDPTTIRLPMVTGLGKNQTFTRRDTPQSWRDDPITAATQTAFLPEQPSELQEGWIRVVQHDAEHET